MRGNTQEVNFLFKPTLSANLLCTVPHASHCHTRPMTTMRALAAVVDGVVATIAAVAVVAALR